MSPEPTSTPTPAYLSPSDSAYYADPTVFPTPALESLATRVGSEGASIAMVHGADHPIAVEKRKMWVAITTILLDRLLQKTI